MSYYYTSILSMSLELHDNFCICLTVLFGCLVYTVSGRDPVPGVMDLPHLGLPLATRP